MRFTTVYRYNNKHRLDHLDLKNSLHHKDSDLISIS